MISLRQLVKKLIKIKLYVIFLDIFSGDCTYIVMLKDEAV